MKRRLFLIIVILAVSTIFFAQGCSLKTSKTEQTKEKTIAVEKESGISIVRIKNGSLTTSKLDNAGNTTAGWWTGSGQLVLLTESERVSGGNLTYRHWEEFKGISLFNPIDGKTIQAELPEKVAMVSVSPTKDNALVLRGLSKVGREDTTGILSVIDLQGKLKPVLKDGSPVMIRSSGAEESTKWSGDGAYIIFNDNLSKIYLGKNQGDQIELKTFFEPGPANEKVFSPLWLPATGEIAFWHLKGDIISLKAVSLDGKSRELFRTVPTYSEFGHYCLPVENSEKIIIYENNENGLWLINYVTGEKKCIGTDFSIADDTGRYFLKTLYRKIKYPYHASGTELVRITDTGDFERIIMLPGWIDKTYLCPNGKDLLMIERKRLDRTSVPYESDLYLYDTEKNHIHFVDSEVVKVVW